MGLAAAVFGAFAAMGKAVAAPGGGQQYTSVAVLSQNKSGQLVAGDYPRNFEVDESKPLVVSVTNREGERVRYSVVVELQRVRATDDGGAKVVQDSHMATFTPTASPGETWRPTHEVPRRRSARTFGWSTSSTGATRRLNRPPTTPPATSTSG